MRSTKAAHFLCAFIAAGATASLVPAWGQDSLLPPATGAATTVPVPLDIDAAAIRDGLGVELAGLPDAQRSAIADFYAARSYAPFWTAQESDRAAQLVAALEGSAAQALPPSRYDADALRLLFLAPSATPPAHREVAATVAYLRFADDLSGGLLIPSKINPNMTRQPNRPTPAVMLAALPGGALPEVLQQFEPSSPDYRHLVAEKQRLEEQARTESWGPAVSDGPTLHPGERGPRVSELRTRLARLGYLAPDSVAVDPVFDPSRRDGWTSSSSCCRTMGTS
jgi:murein L,D-transpeptidase YcbB/YkuD